MPSSTKTIDDDDSAPSVKPNVGRNRLYFQEQESGWLTTGEVMQILGISERQVQRLQTEQRLSARAYLERPDKRPMTLYRADQVMDIRKDLERRREARDKAARAVKAAHDQVRTRAVARRVDGATVKAVEGTGARSQGVRLLLEALAAGQGFQIGIRDKLLLTVEEARQFGFSADFLRGAIREKRLRNFGGTNRYLISRAELDALVTKGIWAEDRVRGGLSAEEKDGMRRVS